jgi:nucleotide-binding universal stress UspA family protein
MIGHDDKEVETSSGKPGTTTSELLHSTTRPVLVVPDEPRGEEKILIAYDKSDASARALRAAAELAEIADFGEVHLLTVDMDEDEGIEIQSSAAQYLSSYDLDVVPVVRAGTPSVVIREYAEDIDASVITLGAFGHVRLHQRIFGSTTNDVLSNMDRAVLIMA